jgi:hypothetical protein
MGKRLRYVSAVKGSGLSVVIRRGGAFGDLFNDGKVDVIMYPIDVPPTSLKHINPDHHHWVTIKSVGALKSPRDATCAAV